MTSRLNDDENQAPSREDGSVDWSLRMKEMIDHVRAMGPAERDSARAGDAEPSDDYALLLGELDRLDVRCQERDSRVAAETRRGLADLETLHNANRLTTVGTLTAALTHEFGTPLGVALARAQMIINDETDIMEARKDAEEIVRQVKRLTQMCRDVLDYARPRSGPKGPVNLSEAARQMLALLQMDARKRNAELILVNDGDVDVVIGDASKIMLVITNLIMNAGQAMPRGGTVTVSIAQQHVTPPPQEHLPARDYCCVHVKDVGTGISEDNMAHIFDTFFSTKKDGDGTGLGLAVSRRIAREHGGFIGVVTEVGVGSTFTLYLPPAGSHS
jgi:two-component system NtrC family sensor kinase